MEISKMTTKGIIYVAFGYEYFLMAAYSAYTAKKYNSGITCSVVTNLKIKDKDNLSEYFDNIYEESLNNELNRHIKTNIIDYASFAKGVYLDCDTEVCGDLSPIMACLERFDLILKLNPRPTKKNYYISQEIHGSKFPIWNAGVVFFRNNDPAKKIFADWKKYFLEMGKRSDQPALARSIYENPEIRILSVNHIWNTFPSDLVLIEKGHKKQSMIWHYRNPKEFPDVAQKIYQHHPRVSAAIISENEVARQAVNKVGLKYRILSSPYYQNRFVRPVYLKWLKVKSKIGLMPEADLSRAKCRTGSQFEKVK
jgi:hypothetical protein